MKYDVFISYSRRDSTVADEICRAFGRCGITYFIDRRDIAGGMEFPEELAQAILGAKVVLFLCSRDACRSKFTINEIIFALKEKTERSVLPYIIDGSELPLFLRRLMCKEYIYRIDTTPVYPELVDIVRRRIGKSQLIHTVSGIDFSGPELNVLKGHTDWVLNLAFSPDGSVLASGGCDGRFILWNTGNPDIRREVEVGAQTVCALQFSPDGNTLFTAQHNRFKEGWLGKWDIAGGEVAGESVPVNMAYCRNLVISRDGQRLAASYSKVGILDPSVMEFTVKIPISDNDYPLVYGFAALDDGMERAVVGGDALPLTELDLVSGAVLKSYRNSQGSTIEKLAGSGDCSVVAVAAGEYISVFEKDCFETPVRRFAYRGEDMECVALNGDGSILAGGTKQGSLILWDIHSGRELYSSRCSGKSIIDVAISPDSHAVAFGGEDGDVWLVRFPDKDA